MKESRLFALKVQGTNEGNPLYKYFHASKTGVEHASKKGEVVEVQIVQSQEETKTSYWAWWDHASERFHHIFPSKKMVGTCLQYGIQKSEEAGFGHLYPVEVKEISLTTI